MLKEKKDIDQMTLLYTFKEQLNPKHPIYILANEIDWGRFEKEFSKHYSDKRGSPAKPIQFNDGAIDIETLKES